MYSDGLRFSERYQCKISFSESHSLYKLPTPSSFSNDNAIYTSWVGLRHFSIASTLTQYCSPVWFSRHIRKLNERPGCRIEYPLTVTPTELILDQLKSAKLTVSEDIIGHLDVFWQGVEDLIGRGPRELESQWRLSGGFSYMGTVSPQT